MNSSLRNCDRTTHLKIVAVALVAGIAVSVAGIHARYSGDSASLTASAKTSGQIVKAGKPAVYSTRDGSIIR
jgi:hypothetical protein